MKINEIIINQKVNDEHFSFSKFENILQLIKRDCKPYLQDINYDIFNHKVFRGQKFLQQDEDKLNQFKETGIMKKSSRLTNRKPRDLPQELHDNMNRLFIEKFGKPYRNGVYTTGNEMTGSNYGWVGVFFPIGKYEYIWSPAVGDLMSELELLYMTKDEVESKARHIHYNVNKGYLPANDPKLKGLSIDRVREYVLDSLEEARQKIVDTYQNTNLKKALEDLREIMFWCDKYYLVKASWFTIVESDPVLLNKSTDILKNNNENT